MSERPGQTTDFLRDSARLARIAGAGLARLRELRPLTQCVTNFVSMDLAANALHALGASPAMASAPEEAADFARIAQALVCNIGTPSIERAMSLEAAALAFHEAGKPWVLDPVAVGATPFRAEIAMRLLDHKPTAIRGNAAEIIALARLAGAGDDFDPALPAAIGLARAAACIVAATGPVDLVTDGTRVVQIHNGSPLMTRVTAIGCALGAATAAFLACAEDPFEMCMAAVAAFGVAGELAEQSGPAPMGPGSFRVHFIDRLFDLTPETLERTARLDQGRA